MRDGGRLAATIEVLTDFAQRRVPLKVCMADWARGARFAGSKDRAFISGLALDVLRHRSCLEAVGDGPRGAVLLALAHFWDWPLARIADACADEPHGPGPLSDGERALVADPLPIPTADAVGANVPDFVWPLLDRVCDDPLGEARAFCARAPIDLRTNRLKADQEKVVKALSAMDPIPGALAADALRVPVPEADLRGAAITPTPSYNKGWVEIQDEASQVAAFGAGPVAGSQVLDYCAGGGGKTLALAALMDNSGQIYAYDKDARRLAPIFERLSRAGVRNAQVISPAENEDELSALEGKMDVVFVDAPCTGSGTWRRHPDTKWRLSEAQLHRRMDEQDQVLAASATYVRSGGALVYVTCSLFAEENEDRVAAFLATRPDFAVDDVCAAMAASGGLAPDATLPPAAESGALRLSPGRTQTDGFTITRLVRRGD